MGSASARDFPCGSALLFVALGFLNMRWRYGIVTACVAVVGAQKTPLEYVDPLIGTTNGGM